MFESATYTVPAGLTAIPPGYRRCPSHFQHARISNGSDRCSFVAVVVGADRSTAIISCNSSRVISPRAYRTRTIVIGSDASSVV
ncbi:hypothetical protein DSECCO2_488020 [anaerobic digester metagenome]